MSYAMKANIKTGEESFFCVSKMKAQVWDSLSLGLTHVTLKLSPDHVAGTGHFVRVMTMYFRSTFPLGPLKFSRDGVSF